ncbi:MAG: hypothetical protein R3B72_00595 [Polyangiaceae bacterium]
MRSVASALLILLLAVPAAAQAPPGGLPPAPPSGEAPAAPAAPEAPAEEGPSDDALPPAVAPPPAPAAPSPQVVVIQTLPPAPWAPPLTPPTVEPTLPPPPPPSEPRIRNGFSLKGFAGPRFQILHGHTIWGGAADLALGVQFKNFGALHGEFGLGFGATDGGLRVTTFDQAVTWEFILGDRWRLGLGPQWLLFSMQRATGSDDVGAWGYGGLAFGAVDLLDGDTSNMQLIFQTRYTRLDEDLHLFTFGLSLGGRFKTP